MAVLNEDRGTSDVWVADLRSGRLNRVSVDTEDHAGATWSHDGRSVLYNVGPRGSRASAILHARVDGSGLDTVAIMPDWIWPTSVSPDGRWVLMDDNGGGGGGDVRVAPLPRTGPVLSVAASPAREYSPVFSHDGRFVAYVSSETGRDEVYVVPFPAGGAKWQVSQKGGGEPRWSRDGRELFYVDRSNRIVSVELTGTGGAFAIGSSRPLFACRVGGNWRYDVAPDGQRFLVTVAPEGEVSPPITLVSHWTSSLAGK
jgi:Tol biopolymer transport system component